MMPAALLALAIGLALLLTRNVVSDCNQNCDEGRKCTCGKRQPDKGTVSEAPDCRAQPARDDTMNMNNHQSVVSPVEEA